MKRSNTSLVLSLVGIVLGMTLLAFASVPLYRLFCEATGFGGTPRRAEASSTQILSRTLTVRFNADIDPELSWKFTPETPQLSLRLGENSLTAYRAENTSDRPLTGHATYNVLPEKAAAYFMKIDCFCFKDQTLQPGVVAHMPVAFFIDPAMAEDPSMDDVQTITLSYTFFPSKSSNVVPFKATE